MARITIDTSAVIAVILGEVSRDEILRRTEGAELLAAETLRFEMPNALTNKFKRNRLTLDEAHAALEYAERIPFQEAPVDWHQVIDLARELETYAYFAYPIAVALNHGCPLLSLDGGQNDAGRRAGIDIIEIP